MCDFEVLFSWVNVNGNGRRGLRVTLTNKTASKIVAPTLAFGCKRADSGEWIIDFSRVDDETKTSAPASDIEPNETASFVATAEMTQQFVSLVASMSSDDYSIVVYGQDGNSILRVPGVAVGEFLASAE